MSVYDRDAPIYAQPRLAREQVQAARADYDIMRARPGGGVMGA